MVLMVEKAQELEKIKALDNRAEEMVKKIEVKIKYQKSLRYYYLID